MTDETLPPPVWVDEQHSLQQMIGELCAQPRVAVDTESNSLHAYRERVCLIQFSIPEKDFVVDPFALRDLNSLAPLFANRTIEKIFHAAEYDLICLRRDFGFQFANLFDTMQAARILGYSFVGLDNILLEKFDVKIDKRHQKANWGARPLTFQQIDYARQDTHYLFQLRDLLESQLREKERWEIARDDFALACHVEVPKERVNGSSWRRFAARKDISPRELTILYELCQARDQIAEKLNRPTFKVISDDILLAMARKVPASDGALLEIGLSPKQVRLWGGVLLAAITRGGGSPLMQREHAQRPSDAILKRLDKLKTWRKNVAKKMSVESDIVLPKRYLNTLAENPPKNLHELASVMSDSPWRFRQYGVQILGLLQSAA
ncbi:MAG: HRDC domain-containing protein [Anaerolineae bacterium]|nr:HRDC domain-containing protein [Anaerolineae bacterium]MCI0610457.1 HRDC domain-containing protein [Anaerolineae bacterium]